MKKLNIWARQQKSKTLITSSPATRTNTRKPNENIYTRNDYSQEKTFSFPSKHMIKQYMFDNGLTEAFRLATSKYRFVSEEIDTAAYLVTSTISS